jgi:predicted ATPase/DNA-binding CsgD family transcriptional regulator
MNDFALDPKLQVVAEVAKDLGRTERRIQQMIASGDLAARKATDLEELALRKAGRIRNSTERGVWLIQQEAVQLLKQLRTVTLTETTRVKVGYPKYRPRSKQSKITAASETTWSALKHEPIWKVPITFTSLIGREQDVAMISELLLRPDVRLLTLLGVGGIGKTRLSLQVAREMRQHFSDGVCFVLLAAINDPELVVPAIAQELGIPEIGSQPLFEQVQASLSDKHFLLILDNFEQVVSASAKIEEVLTSCHLLKIMVTSRSVLHLQAEQEFTVPPLALPNLNQLPGHEVLSDYAAVSLFVRRAQAILPAFQVTPANAHTIAEICVRLDGLPLAIELAAARIKLLPPQALLVRLTQRLHVLTSGTPTLPERQQTLRNTLRWSYDLLDPEEQRLFRRLSIFVGGWSLEAVDAVVYADSEASHGPVSVLDGVASLLDNSLLLQVKQEGNEPRLIMLETVREYGLECLRESGEAEVSQRAHALYYLRLAEQAEPHLKGARQIEWLEELEMEQENLRAALGWLLEEKEVDLAIRLGGAMWWFWYVRGYWSEGRRWLEATLELPHTGGQTAARAKAIRGAGTLAVYQRDFTTASVLLEESAILYKELGDKRGLAGSLGELGWNKYWQNDLAAARTLLEESIVIAREVSDKRILAYLLRYLGWLSDMQSDFDGAFLLVKESEVLCRELGDKHGLADTLTALSRIVLYQGNPTQAEVLVQESLMLARDLHNKPDIADALYYLASSAEYQGEYGQAEALAREHLVLARELGDKYRIARALSSLGEYALYQGDFSRATTFLEECLTLTKELGFKLNIALVLSLLGEFRLLQGDVVQATALHTEGLALAREVGSKFLIGYHLVGLAKVAAVEAQPERAARLFGASAHWMNPDVDFEARPREDYKRAVENLRAQLGEEAFAAAWERGLTMTPEQALAEQVSVKPQSPTVKPAPSPTYPDDLTAREVEVLRLMAQGWTDAQIAERLVISVRTVNAHVTSIYRKIGVSSRSGATRYTIEKNLLLNSDNSIRE